jgi:F-type H+-transporting ATPase subunit gamma
LTRLAEIETRTSSIVALRDIVGAMRSLASLRMREAKRALPAVRRYAEMIKDAVAETLSLLPEASTSPMPSRRGRQALVLCTGEHGFVGAFNHRIVATLDGCHEPDDMLFVLGSRGAAVCREAGRAIAWFHPMATSAEGVAEIVRRLTEELYRGAVSGTIAAAAVVFTRHGSQGELVIAQQGLFPISRATFATKPPRQSPLHHLSAARLFEELIADYVEGRLIEAVTESQASENAARFAAMDAAYDNVSKRLDQLQRDARHARQEEITNELLDLLIGNAASRGS